jgi:hypothetical protein
LTGYFKVGIGKPLHRFPGRNQDVEGILQTTPARAGIDFLGWLSH